MQCPNYIPVWDPAFRFSDVTIIPTRIELSQRRFEQLMAESLCANISEAAPKQIESNQKASKTNQFACSFSTLFFLVFLCFIVTASSAAIGERTYKRAGEFSGTIRHTRSDDIEIPPFTNALPPGYVFHQFTATLHFSGKYTYSTETSGSCAVCDVGSKYYQTIFDITSIVNETINGFLTTCPRHYHIYRNESLVIIEHFVSITYPNETVYNTTLPVFNFNGRLDCSMEGYTTIKPAIYYDSPEGIDARTAFSDTIITGILMPHVEAVKEPWIKLNWRLLTFYILVALISILFIMSFNPILLILLLLLYLVTAANANYIFMHELEVKDGLLDWQGVIYPGQQVRLTDKSGRYSIMTFNFTEVTQQWKILRIYPGSVTTEVAAVYGCYSKPNSDSCLANATTACGFYMGTVYNKGIGPVHHCPKVGMIYANCEIRTTIQNSWNKYLHIYEKSSVTDTALLYHEEQYDEHVSDFHVVADVISYTDDAPEHLMFNGVTGRYHSNPFMPDDHCYANGYVDNVGFMDMECLGYSVTSFNGQTCGIKVTKNAYKTVTNSAPSIPLSDERKFNFNSECFGIQCNVETHFPISKAHVRLRVEVSKDFVPVNHVASSCSILENNITRVGTDNFLYALVQCDEFGIIKSQGATINNIIFVDAHTASIHLKCIYCAMAKITIDEVILDISKQHVDMGVAVDATVHFYDAIAARAENFFGTWDASWLTSWMSKLGNTVKIIILAVILSATFGLSIYTFLMFGWVIGATVLLLMFFIDFIFYFYAFHA